ncbi:autotransporter domain-containing protein [Xenorhabdus nematophila]|uniref:Extracellular serine protease n=1 Tax=Xenorhabdus nematophila (strain ATCC 19061 / DSM 3370 / CCUG 14189 / LMG 1036 / NCIMB 9965 / AN6) TaxID=406817 RepID=D3VFJ5_XENNA|nr:autotransporter serine protease [Xenorhabdus nematophila]CEF30308.1 putative Extracellular serine protease precursor [Xenorhabdus nematophila str. Websteri]AYA40230.1 autotransporter outer membrane beta-barrel domain-containing protein [Xenorhabdus nematophila]KHD29593.1 serine protease [Xenorhabdus nematophila]MBA0018898.1 autotransporter domain-containing protein [Xenorhabdus nematophila]MCB4424952.1 autotransporter domain-containing protein [Xenorhabdus nematophila]
MKKNNSARPIFLWVTFLLGILPASASMAETGYQEKGKKNIPNSWLSEEFNHQWGLAAIGAHYAYARGYTGKGINVGVLDEAVTHHPEFAGKLKILGPEDPWSYDEDPYTGIISFGAHGNHVSGIIAANRDGKEMHGVAFDAGLITGKYLQNPYNRTEAMIQSNARVINNSWGVRPRYRVDSNGNPIRRPDGTVDYYKVTLQDVINYVTPIKDDLDRLSRSPIPELDDYTTRSAGLLRAARHGKLVVFAAGNANNYNVTWLHAGMPYFFPDALKNYLSVANLAREGKINVSSTSCGYTASYCLSAPGTKIYSSTGDFVSKTGSYIDEEAFKKGDLEIAPTYDSYTGTSMASPHVAGAAAVLMQRFPYMDAGQIADVMKTTATDLGDPGLDDLYGWGMLNLKDAIDGPKMFITEEDIPKKYYIPGSYSETQFIANIPGMGGVVEKGTTVERVCDSIECTYDRWSNDISGYGGLTKKGKGTLELAGKNSIYKGPTLVEAGWLQVSGAITSDVTVQNGATLGGSGTVGSIMVNKGANVVSGHLASIDMSNIAAPVVGLTSSGTLNVTRDVTFNTGSLYLVNVAPDGQGKSARILSDGLATLRGGEVQVKLDNSINLLSKQEVHSLLGQQYNILQANRGLNGRFTTVEPNYLFIGTELSYQPDRVMLDIKRNSTTFASLGKTTNERAIADAADKLSLGHPVYESILMSDTAEQAQQAFQQFSSAQIHDDIATSQVNSSRYLRDTLNTRMRQADGGIIGQDIKADKNGAWVQIMGNWQRANGNSEVNGYRVSNYGVLLGADKDLGNDWRFGVATGYTRSSLKGGYSTSARSDNFHLGLYGSKQIDALSLRAGAAYSWHRFDTERSVAFGSQSDNLKAKYGAQTGQLFTEAAYGINTSWLNLEPFANVSYVNFRNNGINEHGGAAALHGDKQSKNATLSTLGLRVDQKWKTESELTVGLYGELGWQHQFGSIDRGTKLSFSNSNSTFTINSVSPERDAAVIKAGTEFGINENTKLSLGYNGVLSSSHKDNGVFLNANLRF